MSPTNPKPGRDSAVDAAAKALLEAVRAQAIASVGGNEAPPLSTLMCVATVALAAEVADHDAEAPFHGIARALASMAVAERVSKHQLISALNAAMAPTFASPLSRRLQKGGRA